MPSDTAFFAEPHRAWAAAALGLIVAVGIGDYLTGQELTFSVFYLVPVAGLSWFAGKRVAIAASSFAAVTWLCAEIASSRVDSSHLVYAWNFCARLLFLMLVALLLARLREMLMAERTLSRTDALTGLPNARAFREAAVAEIARARRNRGPLSIAFIDLDDFKVVNDAQGHAAGDRLLRRIAGEMRSSLRASDIVARYGGDEFVVLLPDTDEQAAGGVIGSLVQRAAAAAAGEGLVIALSVGTASCDLGGSSIDELLERADRRMYEAKASAKCDPRRPDET